MGFVTMGSVKRNILALTFANLCIGLVEFVFSLYLSRVLGTEGLGMLHLVTPINCLFLSFMTEGLVTTTSKISAAHYAHGRLDLMDRSIKVYTAFSFLWALVLVGIVFLTARPLAEWFLGEPALYYPILSTCPLMLLMSVSNIVKGHFLGLSRIKIPALINVTEKLFRFPILYLLIRFCLNRVPVPAVTFVYLCYGIGEIHSVFWLIVYYRWDGRRLLRTAASAPVSAKATDRSDGQGRKNRRSKTAPWTLLKPLIAGAVPICSTQCLLELSGAFASVAVKARLCAIGMSSAEALSLLGKYRGMVFPLMAYPMILIGSICNIIVPQVSTLLEDGKHSAADRLLRRCLVAALAIGLLTALVFLIAADGLGSFFYKRDDLGLLIRLSGFCAPILDVAAVSTSLLIGVSKESQSFRNALMQQLLLLISIILLVGVPSLNIYGYILSFALSNTVLVIINLYFLKEHIFDRQSSSSLHKRGV